MASAGGGTEPGAPTITGITPGDGSLLVAFTPPASDGGAAISNYQYSTDGTNYVDRSPASTNSPLLISGLTNGATYPVTLKAVNSVGAGTASSSTNGTPEAATQPPVITSTNFSGQVGVLFSQTIPASGGPTNFTLVSGPLPGGLIFNSNNGTIAGMPTNAVTNSLTVRAQNSQGSSSDATIGLAIAKGNQIITFGALANRTVGDAPFTLSATANSGLPVSYSSSSNSVATVSNNTVTVVGAGTTTITASQAGDLNWNPAMDVAQTLTVQAAPVQVTLPHTDPFDYPAGSFLVSSNQTAAGWNNLNTGDSINISSGSLTYEGLPESTGNKISFDGAGMDATKIFTQQTNGTVYWSFLINIPALGSMTTGGYLAGFIEGTTGSTYGATLWARQSGTGFNLGINPRTTATNTVWTGGTNSVGTTNLVVVSYTVVPGATNNDVVKLWLNPQLGEATEPTPTLVATNTTGSDLLNLNRILLRQDSSIPFVEMDEFRLATTWAEVTPAGNTTGPRISVSPTSIAGLTATAGTVSAVTNYTVTGTNLTSNVTVSLPSSPVIEISTNSTSGFGTTALTLTPTAGVVSNVIYLRIPSTATATNFSNVITNASAGATTRIVTVSGTVTAPVPPTFTSTNAYSGTVGVAFSNTATATGDAPISFSGSGLPGGLGIASNGLISGTPTTAGSTNATLTASNAVGTTNRSVTFTIAKGTPVIVTPPTAPSIGIGSTLSSSIPTGGSATGGGSNLPGAFTWVNPSTVVNVAGTTNYPMVFTPTDTNNWNTVTTNVSLTVSSDTNAPTVKLSGVNPIILPVGGTFTDPGASATDLVGTNTVSASITATNSNVNPALAGTYSVTYTSTDSAGNSGTATRTVIVKSGIVALDSSANYGGGWSSGTNGGTGFGPWAISANPGTGFSGNFIGDPNSAGITGMGSEAFGLYANPVNSGAGVSADRSLSTPLAVGQVFSFQWGLNWDTDGGNKGFNLYVGGTGGTEVVNVNQGGFPGDITFGGINTGISYGTEPMTWKFERTSTTGLKITATGRSGGTNAVFTTNLVLTSSAIDSFRWYASGMGNQDQRQPYFNNLVVESPDTLAPNLSFKAGVDRLTWVALNGSGAVSTNDVNVSDPSGIASLTNSPSTVNTSTNGITTVTYTAVDGVGNAGSLSRVIVVGSGTPSEGHQLLGANTSLPTTATLTVKAQLNLPGATEGPGQAPNLQCWIGVGKAIGNPSGWATNDVVAWVPANYNDLAQNEADEYTADLDLDTAPLNLAAGTIYYLVTRWQIGGGAYFYSGVGGPWDSGNNPSLILAVTTGEQYDLWLAGATPTSRSLAEFALGASGPGRPPYSGGSAPVSIVDDGSGGKVLRFTYWVRLNSDNGPDVLDGGLVVTPQVATSLDGTYADVDSSSIGDGAGLLDLEISGSTVTMQEKYVDVPVSGPKKFVRIKVEKP